MAGTGRVNRRSVLLGAAAVAGAAVAGELPAGQAVAGTVPETAPPGTTVRPGDSRYPLLTTGNNQRFVARPDYVRLITSPEDAEAAVRDAVRAGKRVSVRSGGHCFENFVCNPDVEVILDLSEMNGVSYDPARRAFVIEAGARLLNVYENLIKGWNVTIPGGNCYSVGAGGHICGGGYGLLSRAHGLTVDHLYAVEVVVVDEAGRVRTVVATREESDPNRDLWWGHTGGGGGNFGVVTRYWFRSPGATGTNPADQLMSPPSTVLVSAPEIPWDQLSETGFTRLVKNFGAWHENNSAPGSPYSTLSSVFLVSHRVSGSMPMFTVMDAAAPDARRLFDDYLAAIFDGVDVTPRAATRPMGEFGLFPDLAQPRELPWLQANRLFGTGNATVNDPTLRSAYKSAYLRRNFTDDQIATLYRYLSAPDYPNPNTMVALISFGCQINTVAPDATALAQRDTIMKLCYQTFWTDEQDDDFNLGWNRGVFEGMFATTGGAPIPDTATDGCYINYPDNDMADPARNRSGVPWHTMYYKGNYPRLQQVKRRWDPTNFFRHPMSIEPDAG